MTIWHDKNETPTNDEDILVKLYNGLIIVSDPHNMYSFNIESWCYLDDLLSIEKRLKEAEQVIEFLNELNYNPHAKAYLNKYKGNKQ